ncbi:MAG: hypothetical protein WBK99_03860, partial [Solirubrobacterales bacterium]
MTVGEVAALAAGLAAAALVVFAAEVGRIPAINRRATAVATALARVARRWRAVLDVANREGRTPVVAGRRRPAIAAAVAGGLAGYWFAGWVGAAVAIPGSPVAANAFLVSRRRRYA